MSEADLPKYENEVLRRISDYFEPGVIKSITTGDNEMSEELKPCPFCGDTPHAFEGMAGLCVYCWSEDGSCGHRGIIMTLEEWNTRTPPEYKYATYEEWAGDRPEPFNEVEEMILEVSELAFEAARELKEK